MTAVAAQQSRAFPEAPALIENLGSIWVVHHVNASLIGCLTEVSGPFKLIRDAVESNRAGLISPHILVLHKKERLIVAIVNLRYDDRPAKRETEIVLPEVSFLGVNCILFPRVGI